MELHPSRLENPSFFACLRKGVLSQRLSLRESSDPRKFSYHILHFRLLPPKIVPGSAPFDTLTLEMTSPHSGFRVTAQTKRSLLYSADDQIQSAELSADRKRDYKDQIIDLCNAVSEAGFDHGEARTAIIAKVDSIIKTLASDSFGESTSRDRDNKIDNAIYLIDMAGAHTDTPEDDLWLL